MVSYGSVGVHDVGEPTKKSDAASASGVIIDAEKVRFEFVSTSNRCETLKQIHSRRESQSCSAQTGEVCRAERPPHAPRMP